MSALWALGFVGLGTILNVLGLVCAARALVHAWKAYGQGPLLPWLANGLIRAAAVLRHLTPWAKRNATVQTMSGSMAVTSSLSARVTIRVGFPESLSDRERIDRLVRAVEGIYDELGEYRSISNREQAAVSERVSKLAAQLDTESKRLETLSKEAVSQDVRLQLLGLLFIGFGTVLTLVPTVWQLVSTL